MMAKSLGNGKIRARLSGQFGASLKSAMGQKQTLSDRTSLDDMLTASDVRDRLIGLKPYSQEP